MTGRRSVSRGGTFAMGAVADAPVPIAKDIPAAPSAGKAILRGLCFEARFVRAMLEPSYTCKETQHSRWGRVEFVTRDRDPIERDVFFA
jgi:hypothetical protein